MRVRRFSVLVAFGAAACGPVEELCRDLDVCLPVARPLEARSLHRGRDVERPAFLTVAGKPQVQFEVRTAQAGGGRMGASDLWLVAWESGEERLLVGNKSDRWAMDADPAGVRFVMTDERLIESMGAGGTPIPVATLTRMSLTDGILERIPEVSSFSVGRAGTRFFFRRPTAGSSMPELHLRDGERERVVGRSSGIAQILDNGHFYFILGEDRSLARLRAIDGEVEPLRAHVSRFMIRPPDRDSPDGRFIALAVSEMGKPQNLILDLKSMSERRLPGANVCCWLEFAGDTFVYAEGAAAGAPARLHFFDAASGEDRAITLPAGLSDVAGMIARPQSDDVLLVDSRGRIALMRPGDDPPARALEDFRPSNPSFTEDGRFIVYVDPETTMPVTEGRLMVQDAEFRQPPRALSPRGSLVPYNGFFFINDGVRRILVFWAHFGRNASDLYFANHETGDARVVAQGISEVSVTARRLVGIVRVSQQDLVGDLVHKDLLLDQELVIAHQVSDATVGGFMRRSPEDKPFQPVAFVVRERFPSDFDGLWATSLVLP